MKTKLAVISDIHANAVALSAVLKEIKNEAVDRTIVLGDILTYGCQPLEVISLLKKYNEVNHVVFIKGNHDQFYFNLQSDSNHSEYELPKFVEESVSWTMKKLLNVKLEAIFDWRENYLFGDSYFSHANPFKYGDWSYIEDAKNLNKSLKTLANKNLFTGVFGHSHRQIFIGKKGDDMFEMEKFSSNDNIDQLIINTGSVGQPRGSGLGYAVLVFRDEKLISASFKRLKINLSKSINLIKKAGFSAETERKLIGYLEE